MARSEPHGYSLPPSPFHQIDGLEITEIVKQAMSTHGIREPTAVQTQGIAAVLAGAHVVMHSGTGTGKTLAYLLPVLQRLRTDEGRAVVFAPGAELAMQTLAVAMAYKDEPLTAAAAVSSSSHRRQRKRIGRSTRLIIGTPDRLLEMFRSGKLKGVRTIVLDELEPILAARGADFLYELLSRSTPKFQLIVATATLGQRSQGFIDRFMADRVHVQPDEQPLREAISHHVVRVPPAAGREVVLARFIQKNKCNPAIIFTSEPRHHSHLFHFLREHRITTATLSRQLTKAQRQRGLTAFRAGDVRALVTTDAAARGIDVPNVGWVLHYDLPRTSAAYLHRAGRTGRAGQRGHSVVFTDHTSHGTLRRFARELQVAFAESRV